MRTFLVFLFQFLCLSFLYGQAVHIKGKAPDFKGEKIKIVLYEDLLSMKEVTVATSEIQNDGSFELEADIPVTQRAYLGIGMQQSSIFLVPGNSYSVFIPAPDTTRFINPNIPYSVGMYFENVDSTELNNRIIDFNRKVDAFWVKHYKQFVMGRGKAALDSFVTATNREYASVSDQYLKHHVRYSLYSLVYGISKGKKGLEKEYFVGKPVLYHNNEYMLLFNEVFKQYLQKIAYDKTAQAVTSAIAMKPSYSVAKEELATYNTNLASDTLVELVLLKCLPDFYYMPDVNRDNILLVLEQLRDQTKIDQHRKMAINIIASFSKLDKGKPAPDFTLVDKDGNKINLTDFRGSYVYLDFWATWCTPCLREMKVVPSLYKRYGDKIRFVSISIDEDVSKMQSFLEKNPKYEWMFLYAGNGKLKEDYEIRSVPTYFLIGPDGNFVESPARRPSEGIEEEFNFILNPPKKKSKIGIK